MDSSKNSEEFKKFLEKVISKNQSTSSSDNIIDSLDTLTADNKESSSKLEDGLVSINESLVRIKENFSQLEQLNQNNALEVGIENLIEIQKKTLEELSLLRKVNEGSLEYDKASAQYRNTSGREITSEVSGKTISKGGYIDFETASSRLAGQSKRVQTSKENQLNLKPLEAFSKKITPPPVAFQRPITPRKERKEKEKEKEKEITNLGTLGDLGRGIKQRFSEIYNFTTNKNTTTKKEIDSEEIEKSTGRPLFDDVSGTRQDSNPESENVTSPLAKTRQDTNQESDNVTSPIEKLSDYATLDLETSKENKKILEEQLKELKLIREALAPKVPAELGPGPTKKEEAKNTEETGTSPGIDLGVGGLGRKARNIGRGAARLGASALKFAGSKGGLIAGGALAIGAGAYSAYKGFTGAEEEKQAGQQEIEAKLQAGEITPQEAEQQKKQLGEATVEKKGGAIGEGTGMAAGAIGGMKAGAMAGAALGSFVPVVGTGIGAGIGALAGGALGAWGGSKIGKSAGELGGRVVNGVSNAPEDIKKYDDAFSEVDKNKKPLFSGVGDKIKNFFGWNKEVADVSGSAGPAESTTNTKSSNIAELEEKRKEIADMEQPGESAESDVGNVTPSRQSNTGLTVNKESTENADLNRSSRTAGPAAPSIVSNNVSNNSTTSYVPMKPAPRPEFTGSALDRYQSRIAVY